MSQISIRIDDEVKQSAEAALKAMGLTLSGAINVFLTKVSREQRIPFEINVDPFYSRANISELERRIGEIRSNPEILKEHEIIGDNE
ncbi:MAG: type II toxin-antitoxin system RelB/DinJ family antitoxin [Clostridiales bacterium]|nr:type II toxin-antitoxin system RelB/DinJ family antitoxin [Clostridiales bacterium]